MSHQTHIETYALWCQKQDSLRYCSDLFCKKNLVDNLDRVYYIHLKSMCFCHYAYSSTTSLAYSLSHFPTFSWCFVSFSACCCGNLLWPFPVLSSVFSSLPFPMRRSTTPSSKLLQLQYFPSPHRSPTLSRCLPKHTTCLFLNVFFSSSSLIPPCACVSPSDVASGSLSCRSWVCFYSLHMRTHARSSFLFIISVCVCVHSLCF